MKRTFEVPTENVAEFSEMLVENELCNEITGTNENGDVVVEVNYRIDQKGAILDLVEWMDEIESSLDDDSEDDENEDSLENDDESQDDE